MFTADDTNIMRNLLSDPAALPPEGWLERMQAEHPTFVMPLAIMLCRNGEAMDPSERIALQDKVMMACSDRDAFAALCDLSGDGWAQFYPELSKPNEKGTADTIDAFLNAYGNSNPAEDALIERMIFNPVPAYALEEDVKNEAPTPEAAPQAAAEAAEPEVEAAPQQAAEAAEAEPQPTPPPFSNPLPSNPEVTAAAPSAPEQSEQYDGPMPPPFEDPVVKTFEKVSQPAQNGNSPLLMESLAKIFIKQRRYERAFVIINNLSLKYPEKSVYFADQLRFLQKLIINSKYKNQ